MNLRVAHRVVERLVDPRFARPAFDGGGLQSFPGLGVRQKPPVYELEASKAPKRHGLPVFSGRCFGPVENMPGELVVIGDQAEMSTWTDWSLSGSLHVSVLRGVLSARIWEPLGVVTRRLFALESRHRLALNIERRTHQCAAAEAESVARSRESLTLH